MIYKKIVLGFFAIVILTLCIITGRLYWKGSDGYKEIFLLNSSIDKYFNLKSNNYRVDVAAKDLKGNLFASISKPGSRILILDLLAEKLCSLDDINFVKGDVSERDLAYYSSIQTEKHPQFNLSTNLGDELGCTLNISMKKFLKQSIDSKNLIILYEIDSFILGIGSNKNADTHLLRGNFENSVVCLRIIKDKLIVYIFTAKNSTESLNELSRLLF
jgi:hypothetical protein